MIYPAEKLKLRDGSSCTIRSAEPEDAVPMIRYMKTMLGETHYLLRTPEEFDCTPEQEARILERSRNDPRSLMLTAERDGELVASASFASHGSKARVAHRAELGISVRKDCWRQGIGSALMERLIASAAQLGYEQLELTVSASNRRALNLYLKYDFKVYGTRPHGMKHGDGVYDDDYLMVKML